MYVKLVYIVSLLLEIQFNVIHFISICKTIVMYVVFFMYKYLAICQGQSLGQR